jgi:hypothetical protein
MQTSPMSQIRSLAIDTSSNLGRGRLHLCFHHRKTSGVDMKDFAGFNGGMGKESKRGMIGVGGEANQRAKQQTGEFAE